jgi:hypothetical protein
MLAEAAAKAAEHTALLAILHQQQPKQPEQQQQQQQRPGSSAHAEASSAARPSELPFYRPLAEAQSLTGRPEVRERCVFVLGLLTWVCWR